MKNINVDINPDEIIKELYNMPKEEMEFVRQVADYMYGQFDVPVTLKDYQEIKSDMLISAMYIIGKKAGEQISNQTKK